MKKFFVMVVLLAVVVGGMSGCYFQKQVGSNQVGLVMNDGVSIDSVVGPGRYTNMGWYSSLTQVDTSSKTLEWQDDDVWTSDKQVVAFTLSVTYSRTGDEDALRKMWKEYNTAAYNDAALATLVSSRIPRIVKQVTTTMTLDEMLGIADGNKNRVTLQTTIESLLSEELLGCGVNLIDVGVNNIAVDPAYSAKMQEKSMATLEVSLAAQRKTQLETQLIQEQKQTEIDVEKARRANLVAAEEAKVYSYSKEAYELARLDRLKDVIGDSDKIYFIPEGADISLFLGGATGVTVK